MTDTAVDRLAAMLAEYDRAVERLALHALARVDGIVAGAYRMVYDNFNATVVAYSPDGKSRHALCSVAAYPRWVNLFLMVGAHLPDPHSLLRGTGSTVRNVRLTEAVDFDDRVVALLEAALTSWEWPYDATRPTSTEIVAVSERRRARRPKPKR